MVPIVDSHLPVLAESTSITETVDALCSVHLLRAVGIHVPHDNESSSIEDLLRINASARTKGSGGFPHCLLAGLNLTQPIETIFSYLERYLDNPVDRIRGMHLSDCGAVTSNLTLEKILVDFDSLMPLDWVIDLHLDITSMRKLGLIARFFPHRKFVLSPRFTQHDMVGLDPSTWDAEVDKLSKLDNVYMKILAFHSGQCLYSNVDTESLLRVLIHKFGSSRIMFGSGDIHEILTIRGVSNRGISESDGFSRFYFENMTPDQPYDWWKMLSDLSTKFKSNTRENILRITALQVYGLEM